MANTINRVILLGNVGRDAEVHYHTRELVVARVPLATSEGGYKTADGTEIPERTEWHNVVMWNDMARKAETLIRKGQKLYVEGRIQTRHYVDRAGISRSEVEIHADRFDIISRPDNSNSHA